MKNKTKSHIFQEIFLYAQILNNQIFEIVKNLEALSKIVRIVPEYNDQDLREAQLTFFLKNSYKNNGTRLTRLRTVGNHRKMISQ